MYCGGEGGEMRMGVLCERGGARGDVNVCVV